MTDRGKLIELIGQVQYLGGLELALADHLLANGVTFHKWVPVALGFLPDDGNNVYCITKAGEPDILQWDQESQLWIGKQWTYRKNAITHWMPLPNPPEGGCNEA